MEGALLADQKNTDKKSRGKGRKKEKAGYV